MCIVSIRGGKCNIDKHFLINIIYFIDKQGSIKAHFKNYVFTYICYSTLNIIYTSNISHWPPISKKVKKFTVG